jgi:hypothetical protein
MRGTVQGCRSARESDGVKGADVVGDCSLEALDRGTLRQPVAPENLGDGLYVPFVNVLAPVRDHAIRFRRASASSHSSLASLE